MLVQGWAPAGAGPASAVLQALLQAGALLDEIASYKVVMTGLPADAGPNPERPMMTNNAGNLKVIATVKDGDTTLEAQGHLYATVQRFVDMPIN